VESQRNYLRFAEVMEQKLKEEDYSGALACSREAREWLKLNGSYAGAEAPQRIEQRNINVPGLDITALLEDEETAELVTKLLEKQYLKSLPKAEPCTLRDDGE
jgi:hypothetical protein